MPVVIYYEGAFFGQFGNQRLAIEALIAAGKDPSKARGVQLGTLNATLINQILRETQIKKQNAAAAKAAKAEAKKTESVAAEAAEEKPKKTKKSE